MSSTTKKLIEISPSSQMILSQKTFISKNSVYIKNIPQEIFIKDILYQKKFLGQYGHINQIILFQRKKEGKIKNEAIIRFDTVNQAALAILSLFNFKLGNINLKISYLKTKYCLRFLKNKECLNEDCFYIHTLKINDYLFKEIQFNENVNTFKFALKTLNVSEMSFKLIFEKLIGENYFESHKKFPKLTLKKLKNENFIKSLIDEKQNIINEKVNETKKKCKKKNKINVSKENELIIKKNNKIQNISFSKCIINNEQLEHSRFQFVNKIENIEDKVIIPDFVKEIIKKLLFSNYLAECVNKNVFFQDVYIDVFNMNWSNFFYCMLKIDKFIYQLRFN